MSTTIVAHFTTITTLTAITIAIIKSGSRRHLQYLMHKETRSWIKTESKVQQSRLRDELSILSGTAQDDRRGFARSPAAPATNNLPATDARQRISFCVPLIIAGLMLPVAPNRTPRLIFFCGFLWGRAGLSLIFWDWRPRRVAFSPYC